MKTHFLFPNRFRKIGWALFIPSAILALVIPFTDYTIENLLSTTVFAIADGGFLSDNVFFAFVENSIADEIVLIMLILGGLFIGFSRLKNEDEYIAQIRYESLVFATYFNCAIMLFATIFIYGAYFFNVMVFNIFTLLLFFIMRFQIKLAQLHNTSKDDE